MDVLEAKTKEDSRINIITVNLIQRSRTRKLTHKRIDAR